EADYAVAISVLVAVEREAFAPMERRLARANRREVHVAALCFAERDLVRLDEDPLLEGVRPTGSQAGVVITAPRRRVVALEGDRKGAGQRQLARVVDDVAAGDVSGVTVLANVFVGRGRRRAWSARPRVAPAAAAAASPRSVRAGRSAGAAASASAATSTSA